MSTETLKNALLLWEYLSTCEKKVSTVDAVVVCCSYDLRVCDYACDLINSGASERLVLSGNTGNWTRHLWDKPEAHIFHERALANGVSPSLIILEDRSTNFGENIRFSNDLLPQAESILFVTKPNSLLRVKLTAAVQCPDTNVYVSGPKINFPSDVSNVVGLFGLINEMVGDIQRIQEYSGCGYQTPHTLPKEVIESWSYLIDMGFTHHMLK